MSGDEAEEGGEGEVEGEFCGTSWHVLATAFNVGCLVGQVLECTSNVPLRNISALKNSAFNVGCLVGQVLECTDVA